MSTPRETRHSDARHLGRTILLYRDVPSTNDLAASFAEDHAGTVFVADHQSSGRGQYGRIWQAAPGTSLLMSVLLFPPPELRRPVILTAWAAVALGDAIRELAGAEARIKWPNDLLVGGKKVCGLLIEQAAGVVVGLGLNLNQTAEDFAGLPDAASLAMIAGRTVERDAALEAVELQGLFDASRTADETAGKPHPRMLHELMRQMGVEPARVLMVGDTTHDLQMAANAGCASVGVSYGAHAPGAFDRLGPRFVAHSVAELHAWLAANA